MDIRLVVAKASDEELAYRLIEAQKIIDLAKAQEADESGSHG